MMNKQRLAAWLAAVLVASPVATMPAVDSAYAATPLAAPMSVTLLPDRSVTWAGVTNNAGYVVNVYKATDHTKVASRTAAVNTTALKLDDLLVQPGTYYVRVVARGGGSFSDSAESSRSNELEIAYKITLSAPEGVTLDPTGVASWKPGGNNGYLVHVYHAKSKTKVTSQLVAKDTTALNIKKLVPATGEYYVTVIAKGDGSSMMDSRESVASGAQPLEKAAPLAFPTDVKLHYDLTATWKQVEGNNGYRVTVYRADTNEVVAFAQAQPNQTTVDLRELVTESGTFVLRVRTLGEVENDSEDSPKSEARAFDLAPGRFAVPSDLLQIGTRQTEHGSVATLTVDAEKAVGFLEKNPTRAHLQVSRPDIDANMMLVLDGKILEQMLALNANAEVRFSTKLGTLNIPASRLQDMARRQNKTLTGQTLELALTLEENQLVNISPPSTTPVLQVRRVPYKGLASTPVRFAIVMKDGAGVETPLKEAKPYLSFEVPVPPQYVAEDIRALSGVRIEADGRYQPLPLRIENRNGRLVAVYKFQGTGLFALAKKAQRFPDVADNHYAKSSIEKLAARSVINGFEDGTFRPNDTVTRAEFATMLVRALGLKDTTVHGAPPIFVDIRTTDWHHNVVTTSYQAELISGKGEGRFAPQDLITQQEMAAMIARAHKYAGGSDALTALEQAELLGQLAKSEAIAPWARTSVALTFKQGILTGPTLTSFDPTRTADRAMAADMLYHLLDTLQFSN